jgi:hypothetical protein
MVSTRVSPLKGLPVYLFENSEEIQNVAICWFSAVYVVLNLQEKNIFDSKNQY